LGCPYSCHYCCINAIFGKPGIRYWSLDTVLTWIDNLVGKYGVRNIRFDDELFILSPKRVERFCDMVAERNYDLNFWVYGRVDTVRDSLLSGLKAAGVNWICLGIESGSEKVRNRVNKKISTDIEKVVRKIQAHGINVLGNFMFGLPDDDIQTMQQTLNLALRLNCEFANFYTVMPYPGSELYKEYCRQNPDKPSDWRSFSQHSYETCPMPTKYLTSAEVLAFRDRAFRSYFENQDYLRMVEQKFGAKVCKHIEKMLEIRIERTLVPENVV
jgi:radical SAM superfamily enzyme YgiQ (UPF0313 family)